MTNQESDGGSGGRHDAPQSTQGNLSLHGTISFTSPQQPDSDRRQPAQYPTSNQTGFDRWLQRIGAVFAIIFGGALVVVGVLQWLVYDEQTKNAFAYWACLRFVCLRRFGHDHPNEAKKRNLHHDS
jgi:hypothetical protein